jgi:hypothetical protein
MKDCWINKKSASSMQPRAMPASSGCTNPKQPCTYNIDDFSENTTSSGLLIELQGGSCTSECFSCYWIIFSRSQSTRTSYFCLFNSTVSMAYMCNATWQTALSSHISLLVNNISITMFCTVRQIPKHPACILQSLCLGWFYQFLKLYL